MFIQFGLEQQIGGFRGISSLAIDDRMNQRQMNFLFDGVFGSNAVEFRRQCFRAGEIAGICECFGTAPQLGSAVGVPGDGMATEAASQTVVSE